MGIPIEQLLVDFPNDKEVLKFPNALMPVSVGTVGVCLEAGHLCLHLKKLKEARFIFDGLCALMPFSSVPCIPLGITYFFMDEPLMAYHAFYSGVYLNPECALGHAHIAQVLFILKEDENAEEAVRRARALNDPEANELLSLIFKARENNMLHRNYIQYLNRQMPAGVDSRAVMQALYPRLIYLLDKYDNEQEVSSSLLGEIQTNLSQIPQYHERSTARINLLLDSMREIFKYLYEERQRVVLAG